MTAGATIAADVKAALIEAGQDTGQGEVTAYILRPDLPSGPAHNRSPGPDLQYVCTILYGTWDARNIDGETIRVDDQKVLCSTLEVVPQVGDRLWDGVTLDDCGDKVASEVMMVKRLAPGGVDLMYTLNIRG